MFTKLLKKVQLYDRYMISYAVKENKSICKIILILIFKYPELRNVTGENC